MTDWSESRLRDALRRAADPSSDYDLNPDAAPPDTPLRPAGVLAAFRADDGRLVLTKRASGLRHHPGQIALPGGKVDPGDTDATAAALREAREEIGLDPAQVRVLGCLPPHRTVTGFSVTPVLAVIDGPFSPVPEAGEVQEAFDLPFAHIADPARYRVERRRWRGGWRSYHAAPFGPYYLWGATARILLGLARRL
ncbi:CoA pyrophosphatase [Paracoccus sp. PAMC 22219]|uniref:NUDIX hydrolase n=1 Tax=Paracoccus sp. PAMC 22219 TaxID=1569209 RepID=UPI000AA7D5BD|nr:CoA pyrophosphatase [Paracoccus sp. PAMC 22219]